MVASWTGTPKRKISDLAAALKNLVVSLHDVHQGSFDAIREQVDFLNGLGVKKRSLLLIPDYHQKGIFSSDRAMVSWLEERRIGGDEIVLHGYFHLRVEPPRSVREIFWTRFYTANEAEFLDLDQVESENRIQEGLDLFAVEGWKPSGFIAPAWLMSGDAVSAIFKKGFSYTNTVRGILFADGSYMQSQSLCYSTRAAWRKTVSLAWNGWLSRRVGGQDVVRLSLHPDDLKTEAIRSQISNIIKQMLLAGYQPATYSELAEKTRVM